MNSSRLLFFYLISLIPLVLSTARIISLEDLSPFWDAKQYLYGFLEIKKHHSIFASMPFFGKPTEIILPIVYLLVSPISSIDSVRGILLLNNTIFWLIYCPATFVFLKSLLEHLCVIPVSSRQRHLIWLVALFCTPLGIAMQVGRQAICFALIILILGLLSRKRKLKTYLGIFFITITTHIYSLFTAIVISRLSQGRPWLPLTAILTTCLIAIFLLGSYNDVIPVLYIQSEIKSFSNPYLNFLLIISLLLTIPTQRSDLFLKNLFLTLSLLFIVALYAFKPIFIFQRIAFGLDHVLIFYIGIIIMLRRYRKIPRMLEVKFLLLFPVTLSLKLYEGYALS